jgi:hypothetical protein
MFFINKRKFLRMNQQCGGRRLSSVTEGKGKLLAASID